jgi:hypothetical protein
MLYGVRHATCGRRILRRYPLNDPLNALPAQVAFTVKPFIMKWVSTVAANSITKSIVKGARKGLIVLPSAMQEAVGESAAIFGGRPDPVAQLSALKGIRNPWELQQRLPLYPGTFNDFNDRVIQFGYLVLFSPAFPLAPFFALINNVIEIRTSGFRVAAAYQRPVWKARSGIGSWLGVLNVLGFLAVVRITTSDSQAIQPSIDCPHMYPSRYRTGYRSCVHRGAVFGTSFSFGVISPMSLIVDG